MPDHAIPHLARTDLHLLSVFMTVVETGGFSAAQITLNVGQSTISRHIADLEKRVGMRLCQRGRTGFRVTEKGRTVYAAARKLFGALDTFRSDVEALRGKLVGELSIAAVDNWVSDANAPLVPALTEFRDLGAGVHVSIHALAPDAIEHAVLDGRVGLGIGVFHRHRPGLAYEALYEDPMELYCARGHPLFEPAGAGRVPDDLAGADYVRRGYLAEEQVAPLTSMLPSTATAHQMEGVAFMILTGRHIGYLPVAYAAQWTSTDRMRTLLPHSHRLSTQIEIVTRRGTMPPPVAGAFVDILRRHGRASPGG